MAYKLLEAAVIVDLRSTTKVVIRSYQTVPSRPKCSTDYSGRGSLSPKTDTTLFFCTYTSLTWRTTTHGGTTKVTTTGDRAKI